MPTYLSRILGKPVWGPRGEQLGRCKDVLVAEVSTGYPPLRAIAVGNNGEQRLIPARFIAWLSPSIILHDANPPEYQPRGDELWLARQVLDRQIVDTEDRRLVRVNDLQFERAGCENGNYCLAGADVGPSGLMRRLGIESIGRGLFKALGREAPEGIIAWQDVAPLQSDEPIRLRVSRDRISEMHPADIADIVSALDRPMGQALIQTLDTQTIADTLEEVEPDLQVSILEGMPPEQAADVLEEMAPDDAADLLADMKEPDRTELLELMEDEDALDVRRLLGYREDSAGGIMTTEFSTIPLGLTVRQAIRYLRQHAAEVEDEAMYYVYVVDDQGRLRGVIPLRSLVLADPETQIDEIMEDEPITVNLDTPQTEVAQIVAKYDLLAVPVVSGDGVLEGMVTVDDAIDQIIPTAWKKRLPRFFR